MAERFLILLQKEFEGLVSLQEYQHICKELKRAPNNFELMLFSATYSEHCSYKHSKTLLSQLPREGAIFPFENAGGFEIGEHAILFKMESHNHPCAVEPYNGAATGVGGIIRDVLAMNARPIGLCNSLKFGMNKKYLNGVVKGISDYGNCIGVPTVSTEVLLADCYQENPIVNVCAIGLAKKNDIFISSTAKSGLKLMLVGSATMRDGMGGAAFASKQLSDEKAEDKLSIQIANPFMKKKLIEACLEIFSKNLVVACQDCGAAGILSSTSEIAYKSGCGVEINLEKVHIGDNLIKDYEIMLSETQERMLFVVEEEKINDIALILQKFQLDYSLIGATIDDKKYIVKESELIKAELSTDLLINPPKVELNFSPNNVDNTIENVHNANTEDIFTQYDSTVGARTLFQPTDKSYINGISSDLSAIPNFNSLWIFEENCYLGIFTFSVVIQKEPYKEVYDGIIQAAAKLQNMGYTLKGLTNCLNFANPEIPPTMFEFRETICAMKEACILLNIPVCSGNVSFYNESSFAKIKNTPTFVLLGVKKVS